MAATFGASLWAGSTKERAGRRGSMGWGIPHRGALGRVGGRYRGFVPPAPGVKPRRNASAANPKFAQHCGKSVCELRVQSGTRIIELLVSLDSEVRSRASRKVRRTSESGTLGQRIRAMCRWIAYRGETVALEHYVTAPAHSLIEQSMRAVEALSSINGDGFGLGWYAGHDEPGLYREVRPAWSDENLRHLCRHIRSHLFFAHVRASTGTATTRPNCHPFAHGRWMFMHNGQFGDWSLIRRQAEALIPDAFYRSRVGTTDSEAIFLAILGAGADEDPVGATVGTP